LIQGQPRQKLCKPHLNQHQVWWHSPVT
jgi:hypothetical protein